MHELARNTRIIARREFAAYFASPLATTFLIVFVALTGAFTFYVGGFFDRGQADLAPFFQYHPWLFLLLVPAVAMRLWAEERKSGTIELLMTLPISPWEAILGKFLAAVVIGPLAAFVDTLGEHDGGHDKVVLPVQRLVPLAGSHQIHDDASVSHDFKSLF